ATAMVAHFVQAPSVFLQQSVLAQFRTQAGLQKYHSDVLYSTEGVMQSNSAAARPASYKLDYIASSKLPTPWATFEIHIFIDRATAKEHLMLTLGELGDGAPVLARVHSECLTGDALFSQRCDCGAQLESAMQIIAAEGRGALLYLRQEG